MATGKFQTKTAAGMEDFYPETTAEKVRTTVSGLSATTVQGALTELAANSGVAGSSLEMPIIRFVGANDVNGSFILSKTNPLTLTVEVIAGSVQAGDLLQFCKMRRFSYRAQRKSTRFKLRPLLSYVITEADVTNGSKLFRITSDFEWISKTGVTHLLQTTYKNSNLHGINYLRIARYLDKSGAVAADSGKAAVAKFSNTVTFRAAMDTSLRAQRIF